MLGWLCELQSFCAKYRLDAKVKRSKWFRVPRIRCYIVRRREARGFYSNGYDGLNHLDPDDRCVWTFYIIHSNHIGFKTNDHLIWRLVWISTIIVGRYVRSVGDDDNVISSINNLWLWRNFQDEHREQLATSSHKLYATKPNYTIPINVIILYSYSTTVSVSSNCHTNAFVWNMWRREEILFRHLFFALGHNSTKHSWQLVHKKTTGIYIEGLKTNHAVF